MVTIYDYTLEFNKYHDEIVARIKFTKYSPDGEFRFEESNYYSLAEIVNIIELWKLGELKGSFGIGTKLSANATFELVQYKG